MKISVIDIGTNTVLMLVCEYILETGKLLKIAEYFEIPRVGKQLNSTGSIGEDETIKLVKVLQQYSEYSKELNSEKIYAFATHAFRVAINSSAVIEKVKKETPRTDAKFRVKYTGDKVAIFEPNKVAMKMPDGKEYANYHSDKKAQLLNDGEESFTVAWKDIPKTSGDMQFAEMIILWRDAFKEVTPVKMQATTITIEFDKDMSEAKGK